jgi:hypothetical protein
MTAGGWTVIMKRESSNKVNFALEISKYQIGFGDLNSDHFLGLDNINALTSVKERQLMLFVNETQYKIGKFKVLGEFNHYKLIVDNEIDKMPDGCSFLRLNNTMFSALDVDFDLAANGNCSTGWKSGWWFTDCFDHSITMTAMSFHSDTGIFKFSYSAMLIK